MTPRSRRGRSHIPEKLRLSPRDLEILKLLVRYRFVRKHFIAAHFDTSLAYLKTRLGRLYRAHYIQRPHQQWDYFNAQYRPAIYEIDKKGEEALYQHGIEAEPVAIFKHVYNEFAHNLMLSDVLQQFVLGAQKVGATLTHQLSPHLTASITYKFKEKVAHSKDAYAPDAAFSVTYPSGRTLNFTLEVDTGSEPLTRYGDLRTTSYLKKFLQIQSVFKNRAFKELGFEHMFALHCTSNYTRKNNLMKLCEDVAGPSKSNLFHVHPVLGQYEIGGDHRYVSAEPVPDGTLFGEWQRVGYDPFDFKE